MNKILLRLNQLYTAFLFFGSWVLSWFYKNEKDLWLVAEREAEARDNGYWMFRYIVEEHHEINVRYIIKKNSPDYQKLLPWKDKVVEASSFTHYMLMWKAKYCVSTHFHNYFPFRVSKFQLLVNILRKINKSCRLIWLQHGIIKDNHPNLHNNKKKLDIFICGGKPEYDFISHSFGYPSNVLKYTGLARFDMLHDAEVDKKQILVMPTWRLWLNDKNFSSSDYYKEYCKLLTNNQLHHLLDSYGLKMIFYPHSQSQRFLNSFSTLDLPKNVIIADSAHYDVQQLLKTSALLITDYSSVFWDIAYMNKPIIYYQFDEKQFREGQYQQGYYDYHDGLGPWTSNMTDLICEVEKVIKNNMKSSSEYSQKLDYYFPLHDNQNRKRIFEEIIALG